VESADGGMVVDCLALILCCTWKIGWWTYSLNWSTYTISDLLVHRISLSKVCSLFTYLVFHSLKAYIATVSHVTAHHSSHISGQLVH